MERLLPRAAARSQVVDALAFAERSGARDRGGAEVQEQRGLGVDFARSVGVVIGQLAVSAERASPAIADGAHEL